MKNNIYYLLRNEIIRDNIVIRSRYVNADNWKMAEDKCRENEWVQGKFIIEIESDISN